MMRLRRYWGLGLVGLLVLAVGASASVTDPNIIAKVVRYNPDADSGDTEPNLVRGGLLTGARPYTDRTLVFGSVGRFRGIDYVQTCVDDKDNPNYRLDVTVNKAGKLYLIIDNRVGSGSANDTTTPPALGNGVMDWVLSMGFTQTAYTVNISTPATVYELPVAGPGTYSLGAQNDGTSRVMYLVAAAPAGWNFVPVIEGVPASVQVEPGDTLTIDATVSDDDGPSAVTVQWTTVSAPEGAAVDYSPNTASEDVEISFSDLGDYTLKLTAFDGEKTTEAVIQVSVKIPEFALECTNWVEACNDTNKGPTSHYKPTSYMYVRNHSAPRRRIQLISYDISSLKQSGKAIANTYISLRRRTGHSAAVLSVYGVREEFDNFNLDTGSWSNLPGLANTPVPPMSDQITLASLDLADLSDLLLTYGPNVPAGSAWSNSPTSAALDAFLNADNDGTVLLLFVTFTPQDADFEIFCKGYDTANPEPATGKTGIILRGNVMTQTWAINPSPAVNSSQTTKLSQLSWTNPEGVGNISCNVYIGTGEPNALLPNYGFTTLGTGITGSSIAIPAGLLKNGNTYKWIVDVYDSGTGKTTRGYVWSFNVPSNLAPTVQIAEPVQYLWLGNAGDPASATAVLDASASDDGVLMPLTYLWEQLSAPEGAQVVLDPNNVEDKTLILPAAGTYVFKVTVNDGEHTASAAAQIFVGATPCDAAKAKPGYTPMVGDFNNDCYVDLSDFSTFALQWLECHSFMDAPCR